MSNLAALEKAIRETVLVTPATNKDLLANWIFDFRALLLQPQWLNCYAELFWETYEKKYPFQVCGMETAGIPLMAAIVMKGVERGTPVNGLYLRKSRKREGLLKNLEGTPNKEPVILVDDLINSGSTFKKQIVVLKDAGLAVSDIFALVSFREKNEYSMLLDEKGTVTTFFTPQTFGVSFIPPPEKSYRLEKYYEEMWKIQFEHPWFEVVGAKSGVVKNNDQLIIGSDTGILYALAVDNGEVLWSYGEERTVRDRAMISSPVIFDDKIFVGSALGTLNVIDSISGKKMWSYDGGDWIGASPVVAPHKKLVFIAIENGFIFKAGTLVALRMSDGKKMWQKSTKGAFLATPLYIETKDVIIAGTNDKSLWCYDSRNGEVVWKQKIKGSVVSSFAYDAKSELIFFGTTNGMCYAMSIESGEIKWSSYLMAVFSTPCVVGDLVYFTSLDKCVYAYECHTGKVRWKFATKGRIFCSPVKFKESLYVGSNDGGLYELDLKSGKIKSFFQASERIVNPPVWDETMDIMYLSTQAHQVYALKKLT